LSATEQTASSNEPSTVPENNIGSIASISNSSPLHSSQTVSNAGLETSPDPLTPPDYTTKRETETLVSATTTENVPLFESLTTQAVAGTNSTSENHGSTVEGTTAAAPLDLTSDNQPHHSSKVSQAAYNDPSFAITETASQSQAISSSVGENGSTSAAAQLGPSLGTGTGQHSTGSVSTDPPDDSAATTQTEPMVDISNDMTTTLQTNAGIRL
jgi:hypothetical protein